jgi:hypothetical protein
MIPNFDRAPGAQFEGGEGVRISNSTGAPCNGRKLSQCDRQKRAEALPRELALPLGSDAIPLSLIESDDLKAVGRTGPLRRAGQPFQRQQA